MLMLAKDGRMLKRVGSSSHFTPLARSRYTVGKTELCMPQALERKQAPSERQLLARLRPLARYQEPKEHARLVDGMVVEHHLRSRISVRPLPRFMQ